MRSKTALFMWALAGLVASVLAACEPEKVPDCVEGFMPKPMDGDDMDKDKEMEAHKEFCMNVTQALDGIETCKTHLQCDATPDKEEAAKNMTDLIDMTITSLNAQDQACRPEMYGCDYTQLSQCYHSVFEMMGIDLPQDMDDFTIDFDLFMKNLTMFCSADVKSKVTESFECADAVYGTLMENCTKIFSGAMQQDKVPNMTKQPKPDMGIVGEKLAEFEPHFFKNISMLVCEEDCNDLSERHTKFENCEMNEDKPMKLADVINEIIQKDEEKHDVTEACGKRKTIVDCQEEAGEGCPAFKVWMDAIHMRNEHADKAMEICKKDMEKDPSEGIRLVPTTGILLAALISLIVCL